MRRLFLALLASCAPTAVAAPPEPVPALASPASGALKAACERTCNRTHMAQAISAQMIEARCEQECSTELAEPRLPTLDGIPKGEARRVRVVGRLMSIDPPKFRMGSKEIALTGPGLDEPEIAGFVGRDVEILATYSGGALERVTAVAVQPTAAK